MATTIADKAKAKQLLLNSLTGTINKYNNFAILFSGGVDSLVLATVAKKLNKRFVCCTVGFPNSRDLEAATTTATTMNLRLKTKIINGTDLQLIIKQVKEIINAEDVVNLEIACVIFAALEMVKKGGIKTVLIGTGAEETLTGYKRHTTVPADELKGYMISSLRESINRDVKREQLLAEHFKLKILAPYLADDFVKTAMSLPVKFKLNKTVNKVILREMAVDLGIPGEFAYRKKVAVQYGSGFDRELLRLAKKNGFKYRKDYLRCICTASLSFSS